MTFNCFHLFNSFICLVCVEHLIKKLLTFNIKNCLLHFHIYLLLSLADVSQTKLLNSIRCWFA